MEKSGDDNDSRDNGGLANPPMISQSTSGVSGETTSNTRNWRSLIAWFSPITDQDCAESERQILETFGELTLTDSKHVKSQQVILSPLSSSPTSTTDQSLPTPPNQQRIINTLILDQNDIEAPPETRNHLVICHGFGAGLGFWYRNLIPLSRQIPNSRLYAIDWLGMGRSSRPDFPMFQFKAHNAGNMDNVGTTDTKEAINFFLDSFEEWRSKQVGLDRFILLGHSMGGYLAALYALRHPERVQKLILASPVGLPPQLESGTTVTGHRLPNWITKLWNANYTPQGLLRTLGPFGPRFALGYINNRFSFLPPPERQVLGRYFYHISAHRPSGEYALAALLAPGAWAREPLHHRLADLTMPCVFLYGQHDWMDKRHAEATSHQMRQVKIFSVEGANHHLYVENAIEFNRIITEECNETFQ